MEAIQTAVTTAVGTIGTNAEAMIADVLPGALTIAGILIVVRIGMRAFKSIAK